MNTLTRVYKTCKVVTYSYYTYILSFTEAEAGLGLGLGPCAAAGPAEDRDLGDGPCADFRSYDDIHG